MKIETWPVDKLKAYHRQLKDNEDALPKMVEVLKKWGFRVPLLVSKDGYNFKKGYVLRDERYTLQQEGWSKGGEYGYQEVMIHGDYMYIACSRYKEVVELTWVKMSDIKL